MISIPEATKFLCGEHQEYTYWNEYRTRYWRKATQSETRVHYNDPEGVIIVHAMHHGRNDAPPHLNKPFQRFCVVPNVWRERARDVLIESDFVKHTR